MVRTGVRQFMATSLQRAQEEGSVKTLMQRVRPITGLTASNYKDRSAMERRVVNSIIQVSRDAAACPVGGGNKNYMLCVAAALYSVPADVRCLCFSVTSLEVSTSMCLFSYIMIRLGVVVPVLLC